MKSEWPGFAIPNARPIIQDTTSILERKIMNGNVISLKKLNSAFAPWCYQVDVSSQGGAKARQQNYETHEAAEAMFRMECFF